MSFIVIIFTCIMGVHGQNCRPWQEHATPEYSTYQECERHARVLAESIKEAGPAHWQMQIPKQGERIKVKAFCLIPVIDEVVMG